ncbi:signal peptidase I [Thiohalorhabdus sp.]|uniref:signal peptidase I n=1 Tax=Thiohalorhabdus sp. TaxID=3094134 RepID=UPI003FCECFC4
MNFTLILLLLLAVTGGIWLAGWAWGRLRGLSTEERSVVVDYARSLFPVILLVVLIRSFVVEPFKIPSGSMLPTLQVGDFILVNKFDYGLRIPLAGWKITDGSDPERGDVIVFQFPQNESVDFIKRIVALPGDEVAFRDRTLYVNGEPVPTSYEGRYVYRSQRGQQIQTQRFQERTDHHRYAVVYDTQKRGRTLIEPVEVPPGEYFVMGDNRNHSNDSRYWGAVPEENVLGQAFVIWWSWDGYANNARWSRLGTWIP